jgi:formylglycine-generating enzyme required for sulfatase activity
MRNFVIGCIVLFTMAGTAFGETKEPPKKLALDLGGGVKLELVLVKSGEFNMGSNDGTEGWQQWTKPIHKVTISKSFYIGKYDVLVAQFRAFAEAAKPQIIEADKENNGVTPKDGKWQCVPGCNWRNPGFKQEDNHPVVCVTWNDAQDFCKRATKTTGRTVRLPTEAEWEYAARGPKSSKYPWGDKWEVLANVADASLLKQTGHAGYWGGMKEDDGYPFTSPCGAFKNASWCGAFDMLGNVSQWCQDLWVKKYSESPEIDPQGPPQGPGRPNDDTAHMVRGADWFHNPVFSCYSAHRFCNHAPGGAAAGTGNRQAHTGFRVVVEADASSRTP